MRPLIGKLNVLLTIEERVTEPDKQGGKRQLIWREVLKTWGMIQKPKTYVSEVMGGIAGVAETPITVRPNNCIRVGQRIVLQSGIIYSIINIWSNYRDEMILTCQQEHYNGANS